MVIMVFGGEIAGGADTGIISLGVETTAGNLMMIVAPIRIDLETHIGQMRRVPSEAHLTVQNGLVIGTWITVTAIISGIME